ncbi:LUD domain-containing protein [Picrophilus oshimae]|uniref:L-lactate dehydrogenase complex protein LldG n=1 Tax=Picrophilus torridus (strain ATCC 700027 / DSM 9790 / JCM 10055 / NBRC 100828 / KAW 2/3) TaxID=1122961 RepID=A0A8G2FWE4_PICTO|nr:lactate utilization protein B [Picrophilus oshimae]SMD30712.1 L-lactate dehydrogenase complex protein LldG [Picrophilus oshimae DSM 9789]
MNWTVNVSNAIKNNAPKVHKILEEHPYIIEAARDLRNKKLEVINNIEMYINLVKKNVEASNGNFHFARNKEEALSIIDNIIKDKNRIVLSKSNVLYEISLREHLHNKDVWETDLGEYLVQIGNDMPSHLVAPAIHLSKDDVAGLLNKNLSDGINNNTSIEDMVKYVRDFLMEKYVNADVGITGANAIAADTGSVILVENEGNIRMDTVMPRIHIAVTGIDKIVPRLSDAFEEAMVQAAYAGFYPPTYINVTSGPSSTGDIELKKVTPATGPAEFHLILIDNGRLEASRDETMKESLLCIRCGRCYFSCPAYRLYGRKFGNPPYTGPTGIMWSAITMQDYSKSQLCMHSGGCREVCPMNIDIPKIIEKIKFLDIN